MHAIGRNARSLIRDLTDAEGFDELQKILMIVEVLDLRGILALRIEDDTEHHTSPQKSREFEGANSRERSTSEAVGLPSKSHDPEKRHAPQYRGESG